MGTAASVVSKAPAVASTRVWLIAGQISFSRQTLAPPATSQRRPAAASRAEITSITATPTAPKTCTKSDSELRVTSTFSDRLTLRVFWSA